MLFGRVKGPKAVLSSAIASALAEYFIVDADLIESNLLRDTKIVLRSVLLRRQVTSLPRSSGGRSTVAAVTGVVDEVAFTWAWSVASKKSGSGSDGGSAWVKDAVLTIKGLSFTAKLEHGSGEEDEVKKEASPAQSVGSAPKRALNDDVSSEIQKEGGMKAYIRKQVEMVIDALTLRVVGFDFTVEMPSPAANPEGDGIDIVIGGDSVEILSFGRHLEPVDPSSRDDPQNSALRQILTIASFYANVVMAQGDDRTSLPLIEPFSYSAEATRTAGKRFSGLSRGLEVVGRQLDADRGDGFVFHAGTHQIRALAQLGAMLLAPPGTADDATGATNKSPSRDGEERKAPAEMMFSTDSMEKRGEPSSFKFSVSSLSLVAFEGTRVNIPAVRMSHLADGSLLDIEAGGFQLESRPGNGESEPLSVSMSGIKASVRPNAVVTVDSIETLHLPGVFRLLAPTRDAFAERQGKTVTVKLASVEGLLLSKTQKSRSNGENKDAEKASGSAVNPVGNSARHDDAEGEGGQDRSPTGTGATISAPFPVNVSLQSVKLRTGDDEKTMTELNRVDVFLHPENDTGGTQVALCIDETKNQLLGMKNASVYAVVPANGPGVIEGLRFAADSLHVTAGHSTSEWSDTFDRKDRRRPSSSSTPLKCPHASVSALRIKIGYAGKGIAVRDTSIVVRPFVGKADTTARDLVNYYAAACMSRVPKFISNAEVMGLNVVDSTASTYGSWLGMATPFGAGGGVAALTAVDAVKGAVAAGKRSRNADDGDGWKMGDFFRGVFYAAAEATQAGAVQRGKKNGKGNMADWAVGTTTATGEYVDANKSRLGAAGGAGAGVVVGTMLGGPVGAVFGGIIGGAMTGKTIDKLEDKHVAKKNQKLIKGSTNEP